MMQNCIYIFKKIVKPYCGIILVVSTVAPGDISTPITTNVNGREKGRQAKTVNCVTLMQTSRFPDARTPSRRVAKSESRSVE